MDTTENIRRAQQTVLNSEAAWLEQVSTDPRAELEKRYGRVWDTGELQEEFQVTGFMAPYVVVVRKTDNVVGTLAFSHSPRFYHSWTEG